MGGGEGGGGESPANGGSRVDDGRWTMIGIVVVVFGLLSFGCLVSAQPWPVYDYDQPFSMPMADVDQMQQRRLAEIAEAEEPMSMMMLPSMRRAPFLLSTTTITAVPSTVLSPSPLLLGALMIPAAIQRVFENLDTTTVKPTTVQLSSSPFESITVIPTKVQLSSSPFESITIKPIPVQLSSTSPFAIRVNSPRSSSIAPSMITNFPPPATIFSLQNLFKAFSVNKESTPSPVSEGDIDGSVEVDEPSVFTLFTTTTLPPMTTQNFLHSLFPWQSNSNGSGGKMDWLHALIGPDQSSKEEGNALAQLLQGGIFGPANDYPRKKKSQ